jgi:hypothetical protein
LATENIHTQNFFEEPVFLTFAAKKRDLFYIWNCIAKYEFLGKKELNLNLKKMS